MKKHIKPIKGKKQTPPTPAKKVVEEKVSPIETIETLTQKYNSLYEQAKYKQAYIVSLDIAKKTEEKNGFFHLETALIHIQSADIARFIKEYAAATRHYEKVLSILAVIHPDKRFDLGRINFNTAYSYSFLKNYDKAIHYTLISIHLFKKKKGHDKNELCGLYTLLADYQMENKNFVAAIPSIRCAINIMLKQPDKDIPRIASYYIMIGKCYKYNKNLDTALINYKKALDILGENKNTFLPQKAELYSNITICYVEKFKYAEGLDTCKKALTLYKKILPPNDPMISGLLNVFKSIYEPLTMVNSAANLRPYKQFITTNFPHFKLT